MRKQLTRAQQRVTENPLALLRGPAEHDTPETLKAAQSFWLERETRRRILHACFVLDIHQSALFEQSTVVGRRLPVRVSTKQPGLPFPCETALWEASTIEQWAERARAAPSETLSTAADRLLENPHASYGIFHAHLIFSHILAENFNSAAGFATITALQRRFQDSWHVRFTYHALLCAKHMPLRNLLAVSGESWRFGKKLENEADFREAKVKVREWIESGDRPKLAVWHATHLLRLVFLSPTPPAETRFSMLHEQWSMYLACLVCWAWGLDASRSKAQGSTSGSGIISPDSEPRSATSSAQSLRPTGHPVLLDPQVAEAGMHQYLEDMDVDRWEDMDRVNNRSSGQFQGLLETVRIQKLTANMGELLNEAERVLYRLVEGRSSMSHF